MTTTVDAAADWLGRLIRIPSVNPMHAGARSGVPGERALAEALADWLAGVGADTVELADIPDAPDRPNVYGVFRGESDQWRLLDVHLDTVGVEHMTVDPFSGHVADGRVWGRGAVDTKASIGAILAVLDELRRAGKRPRTNLVVVGTVGEEAGGLPGATALPIWLQDKGIKLEEMLIAEPTGCAPVYGHKGGLGVEFVVRGLAAHSSRPELGRNAIEGAAELVLALRADNERLQAEPPTPLGLGTLAVTIIGGGTARNILPDACSVWVSRRLVSDEDPGQVFDELVQLAERSCSLPVEATASPGLLAFSGSPTGSLCQRVSRWSGQAPTTISLGTNAFRYDGIDTEMVVFGPGSIEQAHAAQEWCSLDQLELAVNVMREWVLSDRT